MLDDLKEHNRQDGGGIDEWGYQCRACLLMCVKERDRERDFDYWEVDPYLCRIDCWREYLSGGSQVRPTDSVIDEFRRKRAALIKEEDSGFDDSDI